MLDPMNTAPIPVQKPHPRRALSFLAVVVLLIVALAFVLRSIDFTEESTVIQPPTPAPVFSGEAGVTFMTIQEQVAKGKMSREEGERLVNELLQSVEF